MTNSPYAAPSPIPHGEQAGYTDPSGYDPGFSDQSGYGGGYEPPAINRLALIGFILAFFVSLAAIILGHLALRQIARSDERGRLLAIWALILGYLGFVVGSIVVTVMGYFALLALGPVVTYG